MAVKQRSPRTTAHHSHSAASNPNWLAFSKVHGVFQATRRSAPFKLLFALLATPLLSWLSVPSGHSTPPANAIWRPPGCSEPSFLLGVLKATHHAPTRSVYFWPSKLSWRFSAVLAARHILECSALSCLQVLSTLLVAPCPFCCLCPLCTRYIPGHLKLLTG